MGGWTYIIHSSDIHIKSSIVTYVAQTVSKNVFIRMKTFTKTSRVFLIFLICTVFSLIWRDDKCTLGWRMLDVWYIWPPRLLARDPRKIIFFYPIIVSKLPFVYLKCLRFISDKSYCWKKKKITKTKLSEVFL